MNIEKSSKTKKSLMAAIAAVVSPYVVIATESIHLLVSCSFKDAAVGTDPYLNL